MVEGSKRNTGITVLTLKDTFAQKGTDPGQKSTVLALPKKSAFPKPKLPGPTVQARICFCVDAANRLTPTPMFCVNIAEFLPSAGTFFAMPDFCP